MRSRTPRERTGLVLCERDERGRTLPMDALARFVEKCRFDPLTGCVLWVGGKTQGRGNTAMYGSFWDEGRRWTAHRWACKNVHGFDIDGVTVGHCCHEYRPGPPNTLCVQHVRPETLAANVAERNMRVAADARAAQTSLQRQFWLFVDRGYEEAPAAYDQALADPAAMPFFTPPAWLPAAPRLETSVCPF